MFNNFETQEIEKMYHEGGIVQKKGLTGIDYHAEKHKECMEITHLIVHPATVQILLKYYKNDHEKNHIKKIKEELEMLKNHIKSHEDHH